MKKHGLAHSAKLLALLGPVYCCLCTPSAANEITNSFGMGSTNQLTLASSVGPPAADYKINETDFLVNLNFTVIEGSLILCEGAAKADHSGCEKDVKTSDSVAFVASPHGSSGRMCSDKETGETGAAPADDQKDCDTERVKYYVSETVNENKEEKIEYVAKKGMPGYDDDHHKELTYEICSDTPPTKSPGSGGSCACGGCTTPEPSSLSLLGTGFLGVSGFLGRRLLSLFKP